jgi:Zn ribbon nucleic-acid-binding protein
MDQQAKTDVGNERARLLPCPFCGGEAGWCTVTYGDETVAYQQWRQNKFHFVNCIMCGANTKGIRGAVSQIEAAEQWNGRKPNDTLVKAAEKVLAGLNARIETAAKTDAPHPVFDGIGDLHAALSRAKEQV